MVINSLVEGHRLTSSQNIGEEEDWSGSQEEETSAWADNDYLDYSETFREVELLEASGSAC